MPDLPRIRSEEERAAAQAPVTQLLLEGSQGDKRALDALLPLVYEELHRLARIYLSREREGHTLQPTALVHEAYLRLVDQRAVDWRNRAQFFGVAAQMMRRILVNYALGRKAAKRGGGATRLSLDEAVDYFEERDLDLVALDEALVDLATVDAEQSRIVELRFFGGLTIDETAEVLAVSPATVKREWSMARAWLHREMVRHAS
ncbi:MAG: sigma-70 family RNA polymerase sigma factor [Gemmatimonadota bacterium]